MSRKRRQRKPEEKMDESWLLPYADMLTLLLALFIVLFAMSEVDSKKFQQLAAVFQTEFSSGDTGVLDEDKSIVPDDTNPETTGDIIDEIEEKDDKDEALKSLASEELQSLLAIKEEIDAYILKNRLDDIIGTQLTGEGLLITIRTDITFDSGSAKVKKNGEEIAKEMASFLDKDQPHEVVINGHADDVPVSNDEFASNWELSSMRAIQFMYLLLDESDIEPKFFSAKGFGEYHPIVSNTSEENRAKNRRVEVLIQARYDIQDELDESENEPENKEIENE